MNYKYVICFVAIILMTVPALAAPPIMPVSRFTASPAVGNVPLVVIFKDISTGNNVRYDWNFGDGGTYRSRNAVHTYTKTGIFTATLKVSNGAGTSTYSQTITIPAYTPAQTAPRVFITALNPIGKAPYTVQFMDQSKGSPTAWMWIFNDGFISTDQNPSHTFTKAGSYVVSLRAWNSKGYSAGKLLKNVIIS